MQPPPSSPPQKIWSLGKTKNLTAQKPRGRFVQVEPGKENLRVLFRPEAKKRLSHFVESARSQTELLSHLSAQFRGENELLTWQEIAPILEYHRLLELFENKERAALSAGLLRYRCSLDKLSKASGARPDALKKRMGELSLKETFDKLRKRFATEILETANINHQLRALTRPGYLRDLGISSSLKRQLSAKLKTLLAQLPAEFQTKEMQLLELAKQHRLDKKLLLLALQQLNIF